MTRKEAIANGLKRYFSEKPCKHGHYEKYTNGPCVQCTIKRAKEHPSRKPRKRGRGCPEYSFRYDQKNPVKYLYLSAKSRSKKKNIEFTITESDIIIPEFCSIARWIKLGTVRGRRRFDTPTLDRIDNSKGYVPGNVRVVSWFANSLKMDMSMEEIQELAFGLYAYIYEVMPKKSLPPLTSWSIPKIGLGLAA